MFIHTEYENAKVRCEEIRREFEQEAQIDEYRRDNPAQPFYASTLATVGKVLVDVGSKLQEQYTYDDPRAAGHVFDTAAS